MPSQTTRRQAGRRAADEPSSEDERALNKHVGTKISEARARLAMTQKAFAAQVDLPLQQLDAIELGEMHVSPGKLCDIAAYVDEPICYFFASRDDRPTQARPGHTILFVDDDPAIRALAGDVLRRLGHCVVLAASGREALVQLQNDRSIDCLFTDIVMPDGMNGLQLMVAARAIRPGLHVLVSSGYPAETFRELGGLPADVPFLHKPFTMAAIAAHVGRAPAVQ
jgi:CheY-like chemotaxis protein/DNA-binding XRE family transcriptional regulator